MQNVASVCVYVLAGERIQMVHRSALLLLTPVNFLESIHAVNRTLA